MNSRGNPLLDEIHNEQMSRMKKGESAQAARASMRKNVQAQISNQNSEKKDMTRKYKTPGVGN